ncbi:hypothetical protein K1T71_002119 [Dendrolimus kikuchii]|uniref:Uncharacterized protein n=1 Tax=Dendrolimus kikuchii TaxID=765133 RepID=A0ACC1DFZ8_9NEOP|nr:hypothetical protein K1T71_002119 [Dendrolimus kikuchii]
MAEVNSDLKNEREKCSFNIRELTEFFDGGPEITLSRKDRERALVSKRAECAGPDENYLSYKDSYEESVRKATVLFGVIRQMQKDGKTTIQNYRKVLTDVIASTPTYNGSPFVIHYIMFLPVLLSQANEEQREKWWRRAWGCNIIGTYAQTELGHGTFIRGLETTATYDPDTKEFVLNSPTLTSYKWWPGGLGHTANYCILIAQLYTKGECHGIHAFIVQLRDEETHMPVPGIKIGDIGAKMALNVINNGFLGFDNVRIPRDHMLMQHAQVLEDGTYVKPENSKLSYGGMVFVRVFIVFDQVNYLCKAATIATRYSVVRRQCKMNEGVPETQLLDYVTQQHKIFIAIAASYAFKITATKLWDTYNAIIEELNEGRLDNLSELHASACCLKAVTTNDCAVYVERCRLACGGHGYMMSSNLPQLYGLVTASCTYEGDNTVLLLQTARYLVKTWRTMESHVLTPTVQYLKTASQEAFADKWSCTVENIIRGFQVIAMRKIKSCSESMEKRVMSGLSLADAWNRTSIQLVDAAEAHCRVIILTTFHEEVSKQSPTLSSELRVVLQQLVELYAAYWTLEKFKDFLLYTTVSSKDAEILQLWYEELLAKIRPNAVGLVDSFDIIDEVLQSSIGAYDGRAYERLMEEALKSPLNSVDGQSFVYTFHLNKGPINDVCRYDQNKNGSEKETSERRRIEEMVLSIDGLKDPVPEEYMSHKEKYENSIRKACLFVEALQKEAGRGSNIDAFRPTNKYKVQFAVLKDVSPFMLHMGMFVPTILNQSTPEQMQEWLPKALSMQYIGTYAQTELGHGSFLRGLETTATYDPKTEEFILNSPTLTSHKWWPGGLAQTANHCITVAQLYIDGKNYGVHPFFVQIRDLETHMPLPGISVGEIGPKLGFNTANNGFLKFDHFRIPRNNMLMKNAQVLKDGTYVKSKNDKLAYGTMVFVRVLILTDLAYEVSRAAIIAVRYSAVRRQAHIKSSEPECQIIDFVTQQHKLFIAISTSHVYRVVGLWLWHTYEKVTKDMGKGNMDQLPELHALACCLKAVSSRDAAACVEDCRQACGGHGYMTSSNLPIIKNVVTATITYEGEFTVLMLQTARYLMKAWIQALDGKAMTPTVSYLVNFTKYSNEKWQNTPAGIIRGFQAAAAGKTQAAYDVLQKQEKSGMDYEDAWNMSSVQLVYASEAHCRALLCEVSWNEINRISKSVSANLGKILLELAELYLIYWALEKKGDLLLYSTISKVDITKLQQRYEQLLSVIRPNAVGLVDAFDIRDEILNSALGAYDGRVYERLLEEAMKSPLNKEPVNESFHKYLKPLMNKSKL